ncbi:MAG: Peroxidase [Labilithrix sp.]|nr:Peroxidase [Labilithrix sp.]
MAVRQHALTIVAPVRPSARHGLSARLDAVESDVQDALVSVTSLHFARFVLIDGPDGVASRLAFESNHDGEQADHLAALATALAPFEELLFGSWEGYHTGDLAGFVAKNALPASTFYLGHPGLSVAQILNDRDVRLRLEALLDDDVADLGLEGESAVVIRNRLLDRLAGAGLVTGPVDRGFPAQPSSTIVFYVLVVFVVVPAALLGLPFALWVESRERRSESPRELVAEDDPKLDPINRREDAITQNGLTHHVPMRPGVVRARVMRIVLWFLENARRRIAYEGTLGGISSIHFARWVMLDDDTVLFFSNYDGSWEAYLGDFVDKAHIYLTAVWSNTKWFPDTNALIFGGASKENAFKRWTRTFQIENRIWYSAYKNLTVSDVLRNALVREGASGDMTEAQARAWLARL